MRDTIEVDDRLFPWHLEANIKQTVFQLAHSPQVILNYKGIVPASEWDEFIKEFPKYCGGALLGYLGEEVRGDPVSIYR